MGMGAGFYLGFYWEEPELVPWMIEDVGNSTGEGVILTIGQSVQYEFLTITYLGTTSLGDSYFQLYARNVIDYTVIIHGINSFRVEALPDQWAYYHVVDVIAFGRHPASWIEISISDRIYYQ